MHWDVARGASGIWGPGSQTRRVGWLAEPGFGPINEEVRAVVERVAEALKGLGCDVEVVRIPDLEKDSALDIFRRIHVDVMKGNVADAVRGQPDDKVSEGASLRRVALPALPIPAHDHDMSAYSVAEQMLTSFDVTAATEPLNVIGLPGPVNTVRHEQLRPSIQRATCWKLAFRDNDPASGQAARSRYYRKEC
ncbi:putative amidase [Seiridium cardinale]|uniref:Amidase n=1 Tax=Seiridium cardinale TaxID=138064 RepID=A0ABR2X8Y7_9PEZI